MDRAPSFISQYGQTLSSVDIKARQFGHIRLFSTDCHCDKRIFGRSPIHRLVESRLPDAIVVYQDSPSDC
jgi:hypothetical protein